MTRIAVCFFGITRSLSRTIGSIEKNVLGPARRQGEVKIYSHFFKQSEVVNPRSGEKGQLDPGEHKLIPSDWLELEEPELCLGPMGFEALKAYGDEWEDSFRSLRNLVHQLHSLDRVTTAALEDGAETVIFARPDLMYHDSMAPALRRAVQNPGHSVWLPHWQKWYGVNDRFTIARGSKAIETYGRRGQAALSFCEVTKAPLQGERLLAWSLEKASIAIHDIEVCASRIRVDGSRPVVDIFPPAPFRWARRHRLTTPAMESAGLMLSKVIRKLSH